MFTHNQPSVIVTDMSYTDVVCVFSANAGPECDALAQEWLDAMLEAAAYITFRSLQVAA